MRVRISSFCLPLAVLFWGAPTTEQAVAEFRCSAEISYKWVKRVSEAPVSVGGAPAPVGSDHGAASKTPAPALTLPPPKATPEPTIVRLMGLERAGTDEASAKATLQMDIERQRIRASEACKRDHESYGTCVALKMGANASTLNSLGFSARTELEKALNEECKQQEGACLGVDVTEPKCREIVEAKPTPPSDAEKPADSKAGAKGGKDPKKK
jgi:hypothetical protein